MDLPERRDSGSHHVETPEKIVYEHHGDLRVVRAGTLAALVEHLTRHDGLDASFNRTFLNTYKYFTSPTALITHLIDRFECPLPPNQATLVRLRVITVLKQWLEHFWTGTEGSKADQGQGQDQDLLRLQSFAYRATTTSTSTDLSAAQQLLALIQRRLTGHVRVKILQPSSSSNPPKPILPRKLDKLQFLKIDAKEIARQLTVMEAHLLSKLRPEEMLYKNWQKSALAPNVRALIQFSNQLSNWVGTLILAESDLKKRTQVIGHLVNVANICHQLQNYSALISILSGLQSAPIYRLGRTWAMVTERTCNVLRPLQAATSSAQNFNAYREALRVAVAPYIPFLGLFLKDLTFIEDGNPSITPEGLINFSKYNMLASTIYDIQRVKEAPYCLQPVPELQEYLVTQLQSSPDLHEMWDRSCELEARGRGDENRPRDSYTATGGMTTSMVIACMVLDS